MISLEVAEPPNVFFTVGERPRSSEAATVAAVVGRSKRSHSTELVAADGMRGGKIKGREETPPASASVVSSSSSFLVLKRSINRSEQPIFEMSGGCTVPKRRIRRLRPELKLNTRMSQPKTCAVGNITDGKVSIHISLVKRATGPSVV